MARHLVALLSVYWTAVFAIAAIRSSVSDGVVPVSALARANALEAVHGSLLARLVGPRALLRIPPANDDTVR